MVNQQLARQRRNGCIIILFIIVALVIAITVLIQGCNKKRQEAQKGPKSAMEMAFKPVLPEPDEEQAIAACDRVVFGVIQNPERAAKLVSGKYAATISRAADEQVQKGRLPANQKDGLIKSLQGIVMIESGGGSLPTSSAGAKGVVQMLASTARQHGLKVTTDQDRVDRLLAKARAGNMDAYAKLCRIDERFDPYKCIRGGADFLVTLYGHYGRWDFATAAYHGGQGNVDKLIRTYAEEDKVDVPTIQQAIVGNGWSYPKLFFGCSPSCYPKTYQFLRVYKSAKKDFSGWYFWNTTAAQRAVELYQNDRKTFNQKVWNWKHKTASRRQELMPEIVWYPVGTKTYKDAGELGRDYKSGTQKDFGSDDAVAAPNDPTVFGYTLDSNIGQYADSSVRHLFAGSRPETIGLLMTIAYLTRQESGNWGENLNVTSLVRTEAYQNRVRARVSGAAKSISVHAVGRALDFGRKYASDDQSAGFQYALDYLRACGDICYAKEGDYAIHVALNPRAVEKYRRVYQDGIVYEKSLKR